MKKTRIFIFLVPALLLGALFSAAETNRLQLPVRAFLGEERLDTIDRHNLKLFVNGEPREITGFLKKEKSIGQFTERGRAFILSFNLIEYSKKTADAVSYIITEILDSTDILFILTPLKVYRIDISRNKLKLVQDVENLVKTDSKLYNNTRARDEKKLDNRLHGLMHILRHPFQSPGIYVGTLSFLQTYPVEFVNYCRQFLIPGLRQYRKVAADLGVREGDRWCLHFQQRELYSIFYKTIGIVRTIQSSLVSGPYGNKRLSRALSPMEDFLTKDKDLVESFCNTMLDGHINYNSILYGRTSGKGVLPGYTMFSIFETLLQKGSVASGGKSCDTFTPLQAVKVISENKDHYYELQFDFNGKIETKNIQLELKEKKNTLRYKKKFDSKEIAAFVDYISRDKVKINGAIQVEDRLLFSIDTYKRRKEKEQEYGVLKVSIQLFDEEGTNVYNSVRTMRALKKSVSISHTFPGEHYGNFKLVITVNDLLANSITTEEKEIVID
ncbi:MAG: hypothetical protein GY757_11130 [bacterium]|nr:hypothetical protein [bacterium]